MFHVKRLPPVDVPRRGRYAKFPMRHRYTQLRRVPQNPPTVHVVLHTEGNPRGSAPSPTVHLPLRQTHDADHTRAELATHFRARQSSNGNPHLSLDVRCGMYGGRVTGRFT